MHLRYDIGRLWTAVLSAASLLLLSLQAREAAAVTPFVNETADASANLVGYFNSLALDAQGNPHISYYDNNIGDLKYARKVGGTWTIETADASASDVGAYTSLALDAQGNPHISYQDFAIGHLKYARKVGGTWTLETVDASANGVGAYTSLALDAQGNPHISYQDQTTVDLKYARKVGGTWTLETADASANLVGYYTSLALDAQGNPHISYQDQTTVDLKYARKAAGTWTIETADPSANFLGFYTSLALDGQDNPHISYYDFTTGDLKYARKLGGTWTLETADASANDVGYYTSLALDAQGNPHIGYYDNSTLDLKYARKTGGTWTTETADASANDVGQYTSLALDAQGNPHISYVDNTTNDLKYANAAVHVLSPAGGVTWPVGSLREIAWSGVGPVDILLSADGGASYDRLLRGIQSSPVAVRVPHTPTRFARIKVERADPLSTAISDSLFTIQTSVSLLSFSAQSASEGGALLSWATDPGPQDLAGYRLEHGGSEGAWRTLVALTRETSYRDAGAGAGARYRLFAVNGLGEELLLGEASLLPARPLAAWPLPYRGGALSISFATVGGLGGGKEEADVALYDLAGRLVRTISRGQFPAGYHAAAWDGRDDGGAQVPSGIYLLRVRTGGRVPQLKLAVIR